MFSPKFTTVVVLFTALFAAQTAKPGGCNPSQATLSSTGRRMAPPLQPHAYLGDSLLAQTPSVAQAPAEAQTPAVAQTATSLQLPPDVKE
ncbi:MAG: hypothetical protein ACRD3W_14935, partial [Terriglobales bacterium]